MINRNELHNKLKLAFPIFVLASIVLVLILNSIHIKYLEKDSLYLLEKQVVFATKISKLLHETQIERGMSVGYLTSKNENFKKKLEIQKLKTDKMINELKDYITYSKLSSFSHEKMAFKAIHKLNEIRPSVQRLVVSSSDAYRYYSGINNTLLETVIEITKGHLSAKTSKDLMAYTNLLYYEENRGLERAIGTSILSSKSVEQNMINLFNTFIVKQNIYKKLFFHYADEHSKGVYEKYYKSAEIDEVNHMRLIILDAQDETISQISANDWFASMTTTIDILKEIDNHISEEIIKNIKNEYLFSRQSFFLYIVLGAVIFMVFVLMIIMILQLQKNEKKLKNLLNAYVISSTTDLKGIITGVSQAFCEISGYSEDELLGKPHSIVRHPDIPHELFKKVWKSIERGEIWQGEIKNLRKDGSYYWVSAVISPLFDNGKKVGYTSVRQDVTDGKEITILNETLTEKISLEVAKSRQKDQQMIQQSRLAQMGEMISMIAHQWRQPLTAISATSATINFKVQEDNIDSEFILQRTDRIVDYAEHLSRTIDDFREFFKPDKDKRETSFGELLKSTLSIVNAALENQNIILEQSLEYDGSFYSYPNELKQVILNLIKNAEDIFVEKQTLNPYIKIKTYKTKEHIVLEVSDNGGGIELDVMKNIFNPYFSTKLKKDGTGLGLYMSKTIVEDHCQGKLDVKNSDDGAVFSIMLSREVI